MMQIDTSNEIILDGARTGLKVAQYTDKTVVYAAAAGRPIRNVDVGIQDSHKYVMPQSRYSLAHDEPGSGSAGRTQFEADLRRLRAAIQSGEYEAWFLRAAVTGDVRSVPWLQEAKAAGSL